VLQELEECASISYSSARTSSPGLETDKFMTEIGQPLHEQFAATLQPCRSSVTRAATMRPKLASVGKNESQGE
jgi:hypothetical protein